MVDGCLGALRNIAYEKIEFVVRLWIRPLGLWMLLVRFVGSLVVELGLVEAVGFIKWEVFNHILYLSRETRGV